MFQNFSSDLPVVFFFQKKRLHADVLLRMGIPSEQENKTEKQTELQIGSFETLIWC